MSVIRSAVCFSLLFVAMVLGSVAMPTVAQAQNALRIAAVVNEDVISAFDLDARIWMTISSTGMKDTPKARKRLAKTVLQDLISEKLKLQEAARLKIKVSEADLNKAFSGLEKRNGMPPGGLTAFIKSRNIDITTLNDQLEAQIAWLKVVRRRLGRQITISDEEINERIAQLNEQRGRPERKLGEIYLPVASPDREQDVYELAQRLFEQLQTKRNFVEIARTFSRSPSAAVGGDLGWVPQGQLPAELEKAIAGLKPGSLSPPLRVLDGYYLILFREQRVSTGVGGEDLTRVGLQQIFLPVPPSADAATVQSQMAKAGELTGSAKSCADMETLGKESASSLSGNLGTIAVSKLPDALRDAVGDLPLNTASAPIRTKDGVIVLMVCSREGDNAADTAREDVRKKIFEQRLLATADEFLRDLRRQAFVDIRL